MTDKAIEAAAKAISRERFLDGGTDDDGWDSASDGLKDDYRRQAQAAISAYLSARMEQGWKMCPKEATDEMGRVSGLIDTCACGRRFTQWAVNAWQAMWSAAPAEGRKD